MWTKAMKRAGTGDRGGGFLSKKDAIKVKRSHTPMLTSDWDEGLDERKNLRIVIGSELDMAIYRTIVLYYKREDLEGRCEGVVVGTDKLLSSAARRLDNAA